VTAPVIEVHITNVHRRESFRHHSYLSDVADAVIVGCGVQGYELAIARIVHLAADAARSA
jgi:3-dehydroquinate dehydratase-2